MAEGESQPKMHDGGGQSPEMPSGGTQTAGRQDVAVAPASATKAVPSTGSPATAPKPWRWHVVLLDDDSHTYDYVVRMLQELFGKNREAAYGIAVQVDKQGRAILMTTHREHAELKREQINSFGRDPLMEASRGPMSAVLEPAE
jgi:ATP-dependent Clp protease adaptor protein ClpS